LRRERRAHKVDGINSFRKKLWSEGNRSTGGKGKKRPLSFLVDNPRKKTGSEQTHGARAELSINPEGVDDSGGRGITKGPLRVVTVRSEVGALKRRTSPWCTTGEQGLKEWGPYAPALRQFVRWPGGQLRRCCRRTDSG